MDPRGFPTSLPEFQRVFPDEKACEAYLERLRWPYGFVCPNCTWQGKPYRFSKRSTVVLRCRREEEDRVARGREEHEGGKPLKRPTYGGRLRLRVVPDRQGYTLEKFVVESVMHGSEIRTDGWQGYDNLGKLGYLHQPIVTANDPDRLDAHLPMIHLVFSNLKTWLGGTHHGVSQQHLQAYLNEYVFRFNRRFYPMTAFNSILCLAAHSVSPTYEDLYSGAWIHPNQ